MKILKEKSRSYKGVAYYKYKINIPEVILKQAHLKEGDELEASVEHQAIKLRKNAISN